MQDLALAMDDANYNIYQIRELVEAQNEEERKLYDIGEIGSTGLSSQEILTALKSNEDGDASLFIRIHRNKFVFDHDLGKWFKWTGHYWEEDRVGESLAAVGAVIDEYGKEVLRQSQMRTEATRASNTDKAKEAEKIEKELLNRICGLQSLHRKKNILALATVGNDSLGVTSEIWDLDPWLLGCANGIIDLKTGDFRPGKPEDYIKTVAPTEWQDIETPSPDWGQFLIEIFDENQELAVFLQRLYGYSITGLTTEHILPILWGKGRNGKGTILEVLRNILGPLAGPIQSEMLLNQGKSRSSAAPSPDIMALQGKRITWSDETDDGRHFSVSKVKLLVGGNTLIGRPPFGKREIEFEPTHTLFLLTNNKPHAPSDDYAFWQRVHLIPFTLSFIDDPKEPNERKRDPNLKEKLLAESSGILAWLVKGCLIWQKEGLNPPAIVKEATTSYQEDEDILGHFLDDCCNPEPNVTARAKDLYKAYRKWCDENGHKPISITNFGKKMVERFIRGTDSQGNYYKGIGLFNDYSTNYTSYSSSNGYF